MLKSCTQFVTGLLLGGFDKLNSLRLGNGAQHLSNPVQDRAVFSITGIFYGISEIFAGLGLTTGIVEQPATVGVDEGPRVIISTIPST